MKASPTSIEGPASTQVEGELSWRTHPARRHPVRAVAVLVVQLALCALMAQYTHSLPFAVVLTLVLFLSLSAFYFPTWYHLSTQGIRVKTLVTTWERSWSTYRSYWPDKNGVLLSPFPHRSRLENFRGLFVRFDGNRESVLAFVRRFVAEPEPDS